jgi:hypothetical protein
MSLAENNSTPPFRWHKFTAAEFAGSERDQGQAIVTLNAIHWRRVRPFFYRPHLPFQEFHPTVVTPPLLSHFGGCQFAVPPGVTPNSLLNVLLFENAGAYSLAALDAKRRWEVRSAAKVFSIREIADVNAFKEEAFPIYLSFYERTEYGYKKERLDPVWFARWAESLFRTKCLILGAFANEKLEAICVCRCVEDTVLYSTAFCSAQSLRQNVNSLLLHSVRQSVASQGQASRVFVGMYKFGAARGVDDFYLLRGCSLVRMPAVLRVNPLVRAFLRAFLPGVLAKLFGAFEPAETGREHNPDGHERAEAPRVLTASHPSACHLSNG